MERVERRAAHKGKLSNAYDLSGLVERLKDLEPEFRKADEEAKSLRKEVARPGGCAGNVRKNRSPKKLNPGRLLTQRRVRGLQTYDMWLERCLSRFLISRTVS